MKFTAKKPKYGNKKCELDGLKFDSKAEMMRYCQLKTLMLAGEISDLKTQVPYQITINSVKVCKYIADFTYQKGGETVVEDVKGVVTAVFRIKQKLMLAVHGIDVKIIKT